MFPQTLVVCGIDADYSKVIQDIESVLNERMVLSIKTNLHTNKIFEDLSTKYRRCAVLF